MTFGCLRSPWPSSRVVADVVCLVLRGWAREELAHPDASETAVFVRRRPPELEDLEAWMREELLGLVGELFDRGGAEALPSRSLGRAPLAGLHPFRSLRRNPSAARPIANRASEPGSGTLNLTLSRIIALGEDILTSSNRLLVKP